MLNIMMNYLGEKRMPIALAVVMGFSVFWLYNWADLNFVSTAECAEYEARMLSLITTNGAIVREHIDEMNKKELRDDIKRVKDQQYTVRQFVEVNGANKLSRDRDEELRQELAELESISRCFDNGGAKCQ